MTVTTILGVCLLATMGLSGADSVINHWNLPEENSVKLVEHETRQDAIQRSLNKLVLDKIIEICSKRYDNIHDCPEYNDLTRPEGWNLLGKDKKDPKVRTRG